MSQNRKMVVEITTQNKLTDEYIYTDIILPKPKLEIENALQKARFQNDRYYDIQIYSCPSVPALAELRLDNPRMDELNFLAQRIDEMNEDEIIAYNGLIGYLNSEDKFEDITEMIELIDMTYSLENIAVYRGIGSDEKLGEAVIDGEMEEYIKKMSDEEVEMLDRKKVGAMYREKTKGYFYNGCYVDLCEYDYLDIYDGVDLPADMKPEYGDGVFLIKVSKAPQSDEESYKFSETAEWISLPMTDEEVCECLKELGEEDMRNLAYYDFKSPFAGITDETFDSMDLFYELNNIAKGYTMLSDKEKLTFKAVMENFEPDLEQVLDKLDNIGHYSLFPYIDSGDLYARMFLQVQLPTNFDMRYLDGISFTGLGNKLMEKHSAEITEYGLLADNDRNIFDLVPYEDEGIKEDTENTENTIGGMQI